MEKRCHHDESRRCEFHSPITYDIVQFWPHFSVFALRCAAKSEEKTWSELDKYDNVFEFEQENPDTVLKSHGI